MIPEKPLTVSTSGNQKYIINAVLRLLVMILLTIFLALPRLKAITTIREIVIPDCDSTSIYKQPQKGSTINVPADYSSIQNAINIASNGDVIIVQQGTYYENIDFLGKAITLSSTDPSDEAVVAGTIIDGSGLGPVVIFWSGEGNDSVIEGFTIRNGNGISFNNDGVYCGGGIICYGLNPLYTSPTIRNNNIESNTINSGTDGYGAGIFLYYSEAIIENNVISENSIPAGLWGFGSGIALLESNPVIYQNTITKNVIDNGLGGGIYSEEYSTTIIEENIITDNQLAGGSGNGIYLQQSSGDIINNTFESNGPTVGLAIHTFGGAITIEDPSAAGVNIRDNTIYSNTSDYGGGIFLNLSSGANGDINLSRNLLIANESIQGGAYSINNDSDNHTITIENDYIISNNAQYEGSGICYSGSTNEHPIIVNTTIAYNKDVQGEENSAVYVETGSELHLINTILWGNDGNEYYGNALFMNCNIDQDPYTTIPDNDGNFRNDPLFADTDGADDIWGTLDDDYHITAESPCIDAGSNYMAPNHDYDLDSRPLGGNYDIGADEMEFFILYVSVLEESSWGSVVLKNAMDEEIIQPAYGFPKGKSISLTAYPANSGYAFDHWLIDASESTTNPYYLTVDEEYTIDAYFSVVTGTVKTESDDLIIYPNPFEKMIMINNAGRIDRICMVDISGQTILNIETNDSNTIIIPTDKIADGFYLIVLYTDSGERIIRKLVK